MEQAGLQPVVATVHSATHETGYQAMREALEKTPGLTAVFAINDVMATGAIRLAGERGLQVPGDIAFVGFDDIDLAAIYAPPLTTMRVPKHELGVLAARRLVDILTCCDDYTVTSMLGAELVIRQSCGCQKTSEV
jgi:DNA-binding LacI/PurR family transcriptional regulator